MKKRKQKLLVRTSALLLSLTTVTAIVLLCGCNNKKDGTETTDAATNATANDCGRNERRDHRIGINRATCDRQTGNDA